MLKRVMITTAAVVLLASGAPAQSPPAGKQPTTSEARHHFVTQQMSDQWLASKFKGTDVVGIDDQKIGDVSDILFDKDGKVLAYVVGVGGFLGIGSKEVALSPTSFQIQPATNGNEMKLRLAMNKEQLKQAPEFQPYKAPAMTGQGSRNPATGMPPTKR